MLPIEGTSLGIDWRGIWLDIQGGIPRYSRGLRNPPWSLLPVLPLGFLSFKSGWALLVLATLAVEVISVPRKKSKRIDLPVTFFLITSYHSIRNIADGNLEFLTIAGVLLMLYAYPKQNPWFLASGFLLASAKPQETWLLLAILCLFVLRTWRLDQMLPAAIGVFIIVSIFMLWVGSEWINALSGIEARGSIMDISLLATFSRLRWPSIVVWAIWIAIFGITLYIAYSTGYGLDRCKAALLISASLLLSPYAAGNSLLAINAIGVVAFFRSQPKFALALAILTNLPYLHAAYPGFWYSYGAYYTTFVLFVAWCIFAWKNRENAESVGTV